MNDKPDRMPNVPPFVKFVASAVPMVFDNSLSYYEALCALWKYIQGMTDVINNNATLEEEYIEKFNELKTFVDDYFANLDVQEEINNKLDAMVEDGTLQEIITTYLQSNVTWTFDTVADMQASTNLINGSYARTLGYHTVNDGGAGIYYINTSGTANEMDIVAIGDTLKAHLITAGTLYPEMLGAYGDGTHDDSNALQQAINTSVTNMKLIAGKTYSYATTLNITRRYFNLDGNGATLSYTGTGNAVSVDMSGTTSHQRDLTAIENVVFSAPSSQNVLALSYCIKAKFENLKIYDFPHNGINLLNSCYECNFNNIYLGCRKVAGTVGITGQFGDTEFGNLYGVNVETFIFGTAWGSNCIEKIHAWCFNGTIFDDEPAMNETQYNAWFANTVLIKVDNTTEANAWGTVIEYCNCDTYKTCIDFNSYWENLHFNNLYLHATDNLITYTSTYQSYVHRILIDHLNCNQTIEASIPQALASRIPHIRFVNDNEYEYVQTQTYTDANNNDVTIKVSPNETRWIELPKPSANLTLTAINVYAFIPFKKESNSADINLRRPYVGSNNNSFIYPTDYVDDATTAFALVRSFGTITSDNSHLVPKYTYTA